MLPSVSRPRLRPLALLVMALALAPAALACAEVERTVTLHEIVNVDGDDQRTVAWESDRYAAHTASGVEDECWDAAVVGESVPDACLTAGEVASETDPFDEAPWLSLAAAIAAIAVLGLFTWKRVAAQAPVDRTTAGEPLPRHFDEDEAVALMRNSEIERGRRIEAERSRRDVTSPFLVGMLAPLPSLVVLVLLFGFGRTFGWGLGVGALLFLSVGPIGALILLNFLRPADVHAAITRLLFLGGATLTFFLGSMFALARRGPMVGLNGIDWPF